MSKLKAFTILEMLINLTIMSIIMGLIYFAYSSFVQQVINYQKSIDEQNELTRIYVQLKTDFYKADKVIKTFKGFQTVPYNNKRIEYRITDKYLIRNQLGMLDTLDIQKVSVISYTNEISSEDLVTKIEVRTLLFEEPLLFTLVKEYAPNLKIKL